MESSDQPLRDRLKAALGFAKLGLKDAEGALQSIEGADPASAPQVKDVRIVALLRLKRFAEAERDIDEWLARAPDDPFALSYAMRHGELVDDLARIEKPARKLIASKQHLVGEAANELAWAKFCHRQFDEDAIQLAEITSKSGSAEGLNTLATLYAETGRLDEARKTLLKSIDANDAYTDDGQIGFADQYALARVWEGYGLNDLAATEYGKLSVTDDDAPPARRCIAAAARRRLAGLRKVQ